MIAILFERLAPLCIASLLVVGCAGNASDGESADPSVSGASAIGSVAAYDAVIQHGTKVDTNDTPTPQESASTHLIGWMPHVTSGAAAKQLLTVGHWADIRDTDGSQPFTSASVISDSGSGDSRKLAVKLTLDGGVDLDIKAVATTVDDTITVRFVNTSAYSHWLVGMILEPQNLVMEVKLVPYQGGVIVDASTKVKLDQMEERAPKLTESIAAIFGWLKKNTKVTPTPAPAPSPATPPAPSSPPPPAAPPTPATP